MWQFIGCVQKVLQMYSGNLAPAKINKKVLTEPDPDLGFRW